MWWKFQNFVNVSLFGEESFRCNSEPSMKILKLLEKLGTLKKNFGDSGNIRRSFKNFERVLR